MHIGATMRPWCWIILGFPSGWIKSIGKTRKLFLKTLGDVSPILNDSSLGNTDLSDSAQPASRFSR